MSKTATDNGSGLITGDATGKINYATGEIELTPAVLPSLGATFTFDYQWGAATEQLFPMPARDIDGKITVNLPLSGGSVLAKSVELEFNLIIETYEAVSSVPAEMQIGVRVDPIKKSRDNAGVFTDGVTGTINYSTGALTFTPDVTVGIPRAQLQCATDWLRGLPRDRYCKPVPSRLPQYLHALGICANRCIHAV